RNRTPGLSAITSRRASAWQLGAGIKIGKARSGYGTPLARRNKRYGFGSAPEEFNSPGSCAPRRRRLGGANVARRGMDRPCGADQLMDETKLLDDRRRQDERIKVELAHATVNAVEREGERKPSVDQLRDALCPVGLKIDVRLEFGADAEGRMDVDAERMRHFQRIDNMEIVRPGLR